MVNKHTLHNSRYFLRQLTETAPMIQVKQCIRLPVLMHKDDVDDKKGGVGSSNCYE